MSITIYISGPITGKRDLNIVAFKEAENLINAAGHAAINPHALCSEITSKVFKTDLGLWLACMRKCVPAIRQSDLILLLPGWEESRGARKELSEALINELEVVTLENFTKQF
jgi:hypothetical protein